MKLKSFLLFVLFTSWVVNSSAQIQKKAWYYCIDHLAKTFYYADGNATLKPGLKEKDFYQYGFMKQKGWINKSWQDLEYNIVFIDAKNKSAVLRDKNKLIETYKAKGYQFHTVPMPYPMVPYTNYRKDGTNGQH